MKNVVIRKAVREDCPRLVELVHELALYERASHEVSMTLDDFTECGFGANPIWWAFVAEVDGKVEGFALYYIRYSTWKGQRMYLEDILVTENMRRKGLGKKLFNQLIIEAKEKKFNGIVCQVLAWNKPALNFYKQYNADLDTGWVVCSVM